LKLQGNNIYLFSNPASNIVPLLENCSLDIICARVFQQVFHLKYGSASLEYSRGMKYIIYNSYKAKSISERDISRVNGARRKRVSSIHKSA